MILLEELHTFNDIDADRLFNEWKTVVTPQGNRTHYIRTGLTSKGLGINSYLDWVDSKFAGMYTLDVVTIVDSWLQSNINVKTNAIKYAALMPRGIIGEHIDKEYLYRYHLTVRTNEHNSMTIDGQRFSINKSNTLYRMLANVPHSVENLSDEIRLLLTFDVHDI